MSAWLWMLPLVALGLYGLHRFALWAQARGWIFYVNKQAESGTLGNAVLGIQQMLEPGKRHEVELRQEIRVEQDEDGGPASPGEADLPPWMREPEQKG